MSRKLNGLALADLESWPKACTNDLKPEAVARVENRKLAIQLYVGGERLDAIKARTQIDRRRLRILFRRCCATHADGKPWGFRACCFYCRVKTYTRTSLLQGTEKWCRNGWSGALGWLFDRFPHIPDELLSAAKAMCSGLVDPSWDDAKLHRRFIDLCTQANINKSEYPFSVLHQGSRSLSSWLKREMKRNDLRDIVASQYGDEAADRLGPMESPVRVGVRLKPLERVEFDGHRIDVLMAVEIIDPKTGEPVLLVVERIWLLTVVDVASRAVLGYHVCLSKEYSEEDVLTCLENAILPWKKQTLNHPAISYIDGSGFPSGLFPEMAFARWGCLAFDNGKANLSLRVWDQIRKKIGCSINPGPVASPERRQIVERFFLTLEQAGFHKIPATTGSGPNDPKRRDPEQAALRYEIRLEDILELMEVVIAKYNATQTEALPGRSPLEYLQFGLERQSFFIHQIPEAERPDFCLTIIVRNGRIAGNLKRHRPPYVQFMGVRYYSPAMSSNGNLIGTKIRIEVNTRDLRCIRIYFENGQEFGVLTCEQRWAAQAHDIRTRKAILQCINSGKLRRKAMPDVVQAYVDYQSAAAQKRKKPRNEIARIREQQKKARNVVQTRREQTGEPLAPKRPVPPSVPLKLKSLNY